MRTRLYQLGEILCVHLCCGDGGGRVHIGLLGRSSLLGESWRFVVVVAGLLVLSLGPPNEFGHSELSVGHWDAVYT